MAIGFLDEMHHAFDAEIVQEQEKEQEQELEIENYVNLAYSENEAAEPWPLIAALGTLSEPPPVQVEPLQGVPFVPARSSIFYSLCRLKFISD